MAETYGAALDELQDVLSAQLAQWRRLLATTRDSAEAMTQQDPDAFEAVLSEQVGVMNRLRQLEVDRSRVLQMVGGDTTPEISELKQDLRSLASEVARATGRTRFVLERNGALVEARLGLHRQAGTLGVDADAGLHRIA